MKRRIINVLLVVAMVFAMLSVTSLSVFAADTHTCNNEDECIVCSVADLINDLPAADEITADNAASVVEQIHAIDRLKGGMSDAQYEELLTLVECGNDGSGYGMDVPTDYINAVKAVNELGEGGSLYITKSYSVENTELDWAQANATFRIECIDVQSSFEPLNVTLADINESSLAMYGFYSMESDGWTNKYILPAGTYRVTEIGYNAVTTEGEALTTTCAYSVNGGNMQQGDSAIVEVKEGEDASVSLMNSYGPTELILSASGYDAEYVILDIQVEYVPEDEINSLNGDALPVGCEFVESSDGAVVRAKIAKNDQLGLYIPNRCNYEVSVNKIGDEQEWSDSYNVESSNASGYTTDAEVEVSFSFTPVGSLVVKSSGVGAENVRYIITLDDSHINGNYGDAYFIGGVADFDITGDNERKLSKLPEGILYTIEVVPPHGYFLTDCVNEAGEIVAGETVATFTFAENIVKISAVDPDGNNLAGAHLQVIDSQGNLADEWDSTTEAYEIKGLEAEEYTLRATVAPSGYKLPADIKFTAKTDGTTDDVELVFAVDDGTVEIPVDTDGDGNADTTVVVKPNEDGTYGDDADGDDAYGTTEDNHYDDADGDGVYTEVTDRVYEVEDGDLVYYKNTKKDLTFTIYGPYDKFEGLTIDGEALETENYTTKEGSTIITLKSEYLESLDADKYELTAAYENGTAETTLTVKAAAPKTSDNSNIMLYAMMLVISAVAVSVLFRLKKRTNK